MSVNGFRLNAQGLTIDKDYEAKLTYAFDWVEWLLENDSVISVDYTVQARTNDPRPVTIENSGIFGTQTFVELSGGQLNKSYKVSAKIETAGGLIDRRNFIVSISNRSA